MRRHDLSDREWTIIQPLLPQKSRRVARVDERRVTSGVLWRFRAGRMARRARALRAARPALQPLHAVARGRGLGSHSGRDLRGL